MESLTGKEVGMDEHKVAVRSCGVLTRGRHPNPGKEETGSWKGDQWLELLP